MKIEKHTNMGYAIENSYDVSSDSGEWKATVRYYYGTMRVESGYLKDDELKEVERKIRA